MVHFRTQTPKFERTLGELRGDYELLKAILKPHKPAYPDSRDAVERILSCIDQLEEVAKECEEAMNREIYQQ